MDRIRTLKNVAIVNGDKIENYQHSIENGILHITGNEVVKQYAWNKIFDQEELSKIRPEYIKKTWLTNKPFVEGWYALIETEPFDFRSSNFSIEHK